jgi:hypothetical protein
MFFRLSVRRIFVRVDIWVRFEKTVEKNSISINIWQEKRVLHMKANKRLLSQLAQSSLEREIFQTKFLRIPRYTFTVQ